MIMRCIVIIWTLHAIRKIQILLVLPWVPIGRVAVTRLPSLGLLI
jgi:hypothetical protein